MPQPSRDAAPESTQSPWIVLKRLDAAKQSALAAELGLDAGTLSAFLNGKGAIRAGQLRLLIDRLDLKVVDRSARCVRAETFAEIARLAGRTLIERPQLIWDEE